jgi:L-alanine-DL-glutamate epimerase-like enolase superfamily enzyme
MKITAIESLHADGGHRPLSFVKLTTDEGIVGWSEYTEAVGNTGVTVCIERMGGLLIGHPADRVEQAMALLYVKSAPVWSGIATHARAAICNAMLDVAAKAQGVPVSSLFGGRLRDRIPVYWSHLGGARIRFAEMIGKPELTSYEGFADLAAEAREAGYDTVKMNLFSHEGDRFHPWSPGHGMSPGYPELNPDKAIFRALERQIEAVRKGGGDDLEVMIDLNYNFKLDGYLQVCRVLEPYGLSWAELDIYEPGALSWLRKQTTVPLASGESLYGRREYRPYFEQYAVDVAVVDVIWNGFLESYKIATMAESFELNVAPHNFYGALADCISAQFAAVVPNFRIMEYEVDDVLWRGEFFTHIPEIADGKMVVPDRPGWGTDVIEEAVRARSWKG